jgi:hypothetical protein
MNDETSHRTIELEKSGCIFGKRAKRYKVRQQEREEDVKS